MEQNKIMLILDDNEEQKIHGALVELSQKKRQAILELEENNLTSDDIVGKAVQFYVVDFHKGVLIYNGIVQYFLKQRLHIERLEFVRKVQRRNDVKVPISYSESIEVISKDPIVKMNAQFKDISAGGTCFELERSSPTLEVGEMVSTIFELGRFPVLLEMKVLRVQETETNTLLYGCQFVDMSPEVESIIREFVFKAQVEQRKKQKI